VDRRKTAGSPRRNCRAGSAHCFHKKPEQEEVTYVVAGTVVQTVDWEKRILAGNAAFVAAGIVHAAFNVGQNDARLLVTFSPCIGDGFEAVDVSGEAPRNVLRS
jgi:quercetin dioxygenase-like cupin family protein